MSAWRDERRSRQEASEWIRHRGFFSPIYFSSFFFSYFASSSSRQFNGKTINSLCVRLVIARICVLWKVKGNVQSLCYRECGVLALASAFGSEREEEAFIASFFFVVQMSWNERVFIYYLCDHVLCVLYATTQLCVGRRWCRCHATQPCM